MRRSAWAVFGLVALLLYPTAPVHRAVAAPTSTVQRTAARTATTTAGTCSGEGGASDSFLAVGMTCSTDGFTDLVSPASGTTDGGDSSPYVDYVWGLACARPTTSEPANEVSGCIAARTCAGADQELYRLWGRRTTETPWIPLYTRCFTQLPQAPTARITPGLVLEQIRRIGLPELTAHTQPAGTTLVNLETIFYTHAEPFTTTLTLLGQDVEVHAEPVAYHWHHGDGTSTTTTIPGRPYPATTITHRYQHTAQRLHPRVDVTYAARFRVNNGAWQDIDTTLTITGPQTALTVTEATPQLSGDYS